MANLEGLISSWSTSRQGLVESCMAKVRFTYVDRGPRVQTASMQFGNAFDGTANVVYEAKIATGDTAQARDVRDRFAAEWDYFADAVDEWEGEKRGEILDAGVELVSLWRDRIAQHFRPRTTQRLLERWVRDPRSGDEFRLLGVVDAQGQLSLPGVPEIDTVVDHKVSGRSYNPGKFAHESQPAAYTLLTGVPTFEYHVGVRTKVPQTQVLRTVVSDEDRRGFLVRASIARRMVAQAFVTGDWLPNRSHNLCSRRFCQHWRRCEAEYGGRVAP